LQEFGVAVEYCSKALEIAPGSAKALMRRARANAGRHETDAVRSDLDAAEALGGDAARDARALRAELDRVAQQGRQQEQRAFRGMLNAKQPESQHACE
jgi:hypothetical protein